MGVSRKNLHGYLQCCFEVLTKGGNILPKTCLKVDYCHIIGIIRRWDCIKKPKLLHEFYVRCIILIIKCSSLQEAEDILTSILIVCNNEYCGTNTDCDNHKKKLKFSLSGLDVVDFTDDMDSIPLNEKVSSTIEDIDDESSDILSWFDNIKINALQYCNIKSNEDENYHYCPELTVKLRYLIKTFVLWSGVMNRHYKLSKLKYSSNTAERYFNDLKNRTLMNHSVPLAVDKFFIIHYEAIQGMIAIATCKYNDNGKLFIYFFYCDNHLSFILAVEIKPECLEQSLGLETDGVEESQQAGMSRVK